MLESGFSFQSVLGLHFSYSPSAGLSPTTANRHTHTHTHTERHTHTHAHTHTHTAHGPDLTHASGRCWLSARSCVPVHSRGAHAVCAYRLTHTHTHTHSHTHTPAHTHTHTHSHTHTHTHSHTHPLTHTQTHTHTHSTSAKVKGCSCPLRKVGGLGVCVTHLLSLAFTSGREREREGE